MQNTLLDSYSARSELAKTQIWRLGGECSQVWGLAFVGGLRHACFRSLWNFRADDGELAARRAFCCLPPEWRPEVNGKVPLILNPYGGRARAVGCVTVARTGWNAFDQVLAHHGFAVLKVDNRGHGKIAGPQVAMATFHHLEEVELRDNLAALDQALARFPQLDGARLGLVGLELWRKRCPRLCIDALGALQGRNSAWLR